jgi:tetratricopeptide (TPR) repeat protein
VAEPDVYELAPPPSVVRRAADLEEVRAMLDAREIDVAVDELRWLLEGCHALLEAHKLLGEIAAADGDLALARGHFGYAYQLGVEALPPAGLPGVLPYERPANQAFFQAGKGLAWCLIKQGHRDLAEDVVQQLVRLDPSDPLGLKDLIAVSEA